jgi:hypothetical protein
MTSTRRRLACAALAAVAVVAWLAWPSRDRAPEPAAAPAPGAQPSRAQASPPPTNAAAPVQLAPSPPPKQATLPPGWEAFAGLDSSAAVAEARLRHIRMRRKYPLWTQPLDPANVWTQSVPYEGSSSEQNPGGRIFVVPERAQAKLGDRVRVFARAVDASGAPVAIDSLTGATGEAWYGRTPHPKIELSFGDDGAGGDDRARDLVYTAVLALPADRSNAGDWTLNVQGVVGGSKIGASTTVLLVPQDATLTGEFSEELREGSLVVHAGVEVLHPTFTHVRLELFAGDQPVAQAWAAERVETAGRRAFDVTFYGKVIRDGGLQGPYTVRHATLTTQGDDGRFPEETVDPVLITRAYPLSAFTDRDKNEGNALLAEQERLALEDIEAAKQGIPDSQRPPRTTSIDKHATPIPQ